MDLGHHSPPSQLQKSQFFQFLVAERVGLQQLVGPGAARDGQEVDPAGDHDLTPHIDDIPEKRGNDDASVFVHIHQLTVADPLDQLEDCGLHRRLGEKTLLQRLPDRQWICPEFPGEDGADIEFPALILDEQLTMPDGQLDPALDAEDFSPERTYSLEVSSPGLTRPLKKRADYARFKGKLVKIKTSEKIEGKNVFVGIIKGENEGIVTVYVKGEDTRIPFEMIKKAALEFEG